MRSLLVTASLLVTLVSPALAADDPIEVRETLMESNAASAAVAVEIMKDEIAYNTALGKSVITSLHATALAFGSFFPEGSADANRSSASPKIWKIPRDLPRNSRNSRPPPTRPRPRRGAMARPTRQPLPPQSSRCCKPASPVTKAIGSIGRAPCVAPPAG